MEKIPKNDSDAFLKGSGVTQDCNRSSRLRIPQYCTSYQLLANFIRRMRGLFLKAEAARFPVFAAGAP